MQRYISVNIGNLLLSLSEITDIANPVISQHQQRTAFIAVHISRAMDLKSTEIENIFAAALLHDVGAISIEEKTELHVSNTLNEDLTNIDLHCIRGEILLGSTPWFRDLSKMIRYHHTDYVDLPYDLDTAHIIAAQIIMLSDYVERLVDRNKYILHQNDDIIAHINKIPNNIIHRNIIEGFKTVSEREEFWLDLMSPRLYSLLLYNGPYRNVQIEMKDIMHISEMYKSVIDFKSPFTATHTTGVAESAQLIAALFGLTDFEINLMEIAGYFHDIGKLVIPNQILEKNGSLTQWEFAIIKSHTYYTHYIINTIGGLEKIVDWASYHHEKLDGSGYPFKCSQDEIGVGSRIMTVADIFTAITEDRPYRKGMNENEVYKILKQDVVNKKLDEKFVSVLFDNYEYIYEKVKAKQSKALSFYTNEFLSNNYKELALKGDVNV